jgi:hypothetical protein
MRLSQVGMSATVGPVVPATDDDKRVCSTWWNEDGQGRTNMSSCRKLAPLLHCLPQVKYEHIWIERGPRWEGDDLLPELWHGLLLLFWLYNPLWSIGHFLSLLILYTVGKTPLTEDKPFARPLSTHRTTQTRNTRTHRHPCLDWDSNP